MSLKIGVPAETHPGERRIPVVPDVVKKYQGLGAHVVMQSGAGVPAHYRDDAFAEVSVVD
ncbi:MAG: NAD(P)(+) transhydrogenase (Re/Si-specific) subunit alpha, partial [Azoarcus sp.]|nr:NAD(P)(+) transhydrogenase (Re/Si-specific) subunit alpha [Azoarcus sp.]